MKRSTWARLWLYSAFPAAFAAAVATSPGAAAEPPDVPPGRASEARGASIDGRILDDASGRFRFQPAGDAAPVPLESLERIEWPAPAVADTSGTGPNAAPLFVLRLGGSDRISGRLGSITADSVRLDAGPGAQPVSVRRAGARELAQMPGEAVVLADGFDALDPARWHSEGLPPARFDEASRHALALPAGRSSLQLAGLEPLAAGRLEVTYADPGRDAPGHRVAVELTFRSPSGPESLQVDLGWSTPRLSVRTTGSAPALAIQSLPRKAGWHRLAVDFAPDRLAASVDDQELAYGDGPGGVLTGIKLLTESSSEARADADLRAVFDDLVLKRHAEPVESLEHDPAQDEVRLVAGDQIFGRIANADPTSIRLDLLNKSVQLPWTDVSSVSFRRDPQPSEPLAGLWTRVRWQASGQTPGRRPLDQLEGVLASYGPDALTLHTPYAGSVAIPTGLVRELKVLGRSRRIVLDPTPHHLGNSVIPALDPPQPEGRALDVGFRTPEPAPRRLELVVDVVQAIGVEGDPAFSPRVRQGELLTHLGLDGRRFDQLNRHITVPNDEPLRLRITLPAASLEPGEHTLRFEQVGTRDDPSRLDNLGLLSIALELAEHDPEPPPPPPAPSPVEPR